MLVVCLYKHTNNIMLYKLLYVNNYTNKDYTGYYFVKTHICVLYNKNKYYPGCLPDTV